MNHCTGNPSNPALRYREWRVNRLLYIVVPLLLVAPWALETYGAIHPWNANSVMYLHGELRRLMYPNDPYRTWDYVLTGLAALACLWRDRDRMGAVLDGPVSRSALLKVKLEFLLGSVFTGWLFELLVLLLAGGISGYHTWGEFARYVVLMGMGHLDIAILSFAGAVLGGNLLFALLGAGVLVAGPLVVGSSVFVAGNALSPGAPLLTIIASLIEHLSPFAYSFSPELALGFIPVYAIVGALLVGLSFRWWVRASLENIAEPLLFPSLWNGVYAIMAAVSGLITVLGIEVALSSVQGIHASTLVMYVVLAVAEWFIWRTVLRRSGVGEVVM